MKINNLVFLFGITGYLFLIVGCTQNTFDDIEEDEVPLPNIVTYQNIKPIIDNVCLSCHSNPPQNSAPMPLINYDMVKEAVLNRELLDRISRNPGADGLMPLGGPRLPQQQIDLIFKWEVDGLLEN